jgi:hypothetical protein
VNRCVQGQPGNIEVPAHGNVPLAIERVSA